jgi:geranylgeranyl transferase type-2 subunit alpha
VLEQTSYFFKVRRNEVPQPEDPLAYSELLAKLCPEISTIYNYRRELIQARLATGEKEDLAALLNREFELNTGLIKRHPKSYTLWSYREWLVLESERIDAQHGTAINAIQREFGLCSKMLTLDERNFHVWNYRNWLTATSGHGDVEAFTLQKVHQHPHHADQTKFQQLLGLPLQKQRLPEPLQHRGGTATSAKVKLIINSRDGSQCPLSPVPITKVRDDLKIVQEAIYIQPKEHGVYLYHKWLLGVIQPFGVVRIEQTSPTDFQLVLNRKARNVQHSVVVEGIESFTVTAQQEYSDRWTLTFAEAPPQVIEIRISNGLLSGS